MPEISSEAVRLLLWVCESAPVSGMLRSPQDKVAIARAQSELAEALQPPPSQEVAPEPPEPNRGAEKPEGGQA